jgi:KDO2-lipid IV(A) lauroyltransferase
MIILDAGAMTEEDIVRNTALLTECIEQGIRKDISQWFWVHRRWRV